MACCGDRRRTLTQTPQRLAPAPRPTVNIPNAAGQQPRAQGAAGAAGSVLVRYGGRSRTVVLGAVTRRYYAFVPGAAAQSVDVRDAAILLRSVGFQRA